MKKSIKLVALLGLGVLFLSGCGTATGIGKGVAAGFETGVPATADGAVSDAKGLAGGIAALDQWIKDNLW